MKIFGHTWSVAEWELGSLKCYKKVKSEVSKVSREREWELGNLKCYKSVKIEVSKVSRERVLKCYKSVPRLEIPPSLICVTQWRRDSVEREYLDIFNAFPF